MGDNIHLVYVFMVGVGNSVTTKTSMHMAKLMVSTEMVLLSHASR